MVFKFSWFCLTLSVPEILKNSIFGMLIIAQTLNINNLRTPSTKSINLQSIRKLIEYSLKNLLQRQCLLLLFLRYCCLKVGQYYHLPTQQGTGSKKVKVPVKNQKNIRNLLKLLEKWLTYKLRRFRMVF